jgi:hypothetical protein
MGCIMECGSGWQYGIFGRGIKKAPEGALGTLAIQIYNYWGAGSVGIGGMEL